MRAKAEATVRNAIGTRPERRARREASISAYGAVAGVSRMNYRTFVTFNVVGGSLWALGVTTLGYFLGQVEEAWGLADPISELLLRWAARLHEIHACLDVHLSPGADDEEPYLGVDLAHRGEDRAPADRARFDGEVAVMRERWGELLETDPFYGPLFDRRRSDFALASPPARKPPWKA